MGTIVKFYSSLQINKEVFLERYEQGRTTLNLVTQYIQERLNAEEQYSKRLERLLTIANKSNVAEPGTMGRAWVSLATFTVSEERKRAQCHRNLVNNVLVELEKLKKDHHVSKQALTAELTRLEQSLEIKRAEVNKTKANYTSLAHSLDIHKTSIKDEHKVKDLGKVKAKIASLEKDVGLAQRLYKTEVESFANFEKKFKLATKHVLNNFADLDAKRIFTVKNLLLNFVMFQGTMYQSLVDANEALRTSVNNINERVDLRLFLSMHQDDLIVPTQSNGTQKGQASSSPGPVLSSLFPPLTSRPQSADIPEEDNSAGSEKDINEDPSSKTPSKKRLRKGSSNSKKHQDSGNSSPAEPQTESSTGKRVSRKKRRTSSDQNSQNPSQSPVISRSNSSSENAGSASETDDESNENTTDPTQENVKDYGGETKQTDSGKGSRKSRVQAPEPADRHTISSTSANASTSNVVSSSQNNSTLARFYTTPIKAPSLTSTITSVPIQRRAATAMFNFTARKPRELSFHKGDTVHNIMSPEDGNLIGVKIPRDWLQGEINGVVGIFPASYVEVNYADAKLRVIAEHDFEPTQPDELRLKVGDAVSLLTTSGDGWYKGKNRNGIVGLFPASHVRIIQE